ncbi:ABC transporter ATP-binding protein uup [Pseudobythopirellula maris]|uniref:ATP-binding protein Uup n=1 Tax=Pseudobythopirellula maris TaxID=2527991 RepID=A0A5C5ZIA9_9BACT|nr:ATP-binding cassette domain-containing protein [Pseudobythopirellula maris]TWT87112.1 ABC transporter ATP-binding protein uup [Pseudobythopirellula maris]
MPLVTLDNLTIGFRGPALLDGVSCVVEPRERIGLLGRNGAGKSTLMRLLTGEQTPDHGKLVLSAGARVAELPQDVPRGVEGTVSDIIRQGWPEGREAWQVEAAVDRILDQVGLDADTEFDSLSSGMKRRALLARAIVGEPDLLLLDEPTNHLDIDSITWLEDFLSRWPKALLFVTHDRAFLRRLASRILEIDRGKLFDWTCDYDTFLKRKEQQLAAEEKQNALFDKRLAEEERWIRQGIKARRTRNEGRVRALKEMRVERSERRDKVGKADLKIQEAQRSGRLVAKAEGVSFAYDERVILGDFSTEIMRGDKIGIVGPNGAGKTTLLRVLLGQLAPQAGEVRMGTNVEIAYFDQLRGQLDDDQTVQENVGQGSDSVVIGGQTKHILGYLQDFLFTPERARTQVKFLSGGERNRILLAKLFAKPANVIVLDEPTNDLDAETLEMLEERLVEFTGTLLTVSHDREFLNNVVTSTIVFEPGGVKEYVGGYDDWLRQRKEEGGTAKAAKAAKDTKKEAKDEGKPAPKADQPKLGYNEQRELKSLPAKIEKLESQIAELHTEMADPAFYQQDAKRIADRQKAAADRQAELDSAYARWEVLEGTA